MADDEHPCTCTLDGGCDEEGTPGCAFCRSLDGEEPCPAECPHDLDEAGLDADERLVCGSCGRVLAEWL